MKFVITESDLEGKAAADDYRSGYVYLKRSMILENMKGGKALVKVDFFHVGDVVANKAYIGYRISGDIGQDTSNLLIAYAPNTQTIANGDYHTSMYNSGQFQYIVDIDKIAKRQINLKITTHANADLTAKTDITGWMLILDVEPLIEPTKK